MYKERNSEKHSLDAGRNGDPGGERRGDIVDIYGHVRIKYLVYK
jgi:hypothetical protein